MCVLWNKRWDTLTPWNGPVWFVFLQEVDGCYSNLTFKKSGEFRNMYLSDCGSSSSGQDLFGLNQSTLVFYESRLWRTHRYKKKNAFRGAEKCGRGLIQGSTTYLPSLLRHIFAFPFCSPFPLDSPGQLDGVLSPARSYFSFSESLCSSSKVTFLETRHVFLSLCVEKKISQIVLDSSNSNTHSSSQYSIALVNF